MNWLDIVLLVILAWSVVTAFRKGLTRELIGLASVVIGLVASLWFYGSVAAAIGPYVSSPAIARTAGFIAVFAAVLALGAIVNFAVGKFLRVTGLSFFDHALGAAFGALRGALIAVALILAIVAFSRDGRPPDSVVRSRTAPYVAGAARVVSSVAPHELKEGFRKTYEQVRTAWARALKDGLQSVPKAQKERNETTL